MVMMVCQRQHLTSDRQQQITPADCAKRPRCDLSPSNSRHAAPRTALWEDLVQLSAGEERKADPWYWVPGRSELSLALCQVKHGQETAGRCQWAPFASGTTQADFRHIYPEGYRHLGAYWVPPFQDQHRGLVAAGLLLRAGGGQQLP